MAEDIWYEKYRPKTMDDIIISQAKKEAITDWFTNFKYNGEVNKQCAMLFIGPPGLGKTSLAHVILEEFNYRVKEFNASDIRSKTLISENLSSLINMRNVKSAFGRKDNRLVGIIMDEVDGMFKGDRGGVEELLSYISVPSNRKQKKLKNNNRNVPIICICNIGNVKKDTINSLKRECFTVEFNLPSETELYKVMERITQAEDMKLTNLAKKNIVSYAQLDFRRLVCVLEFIHRYHNQGKQSQIEIDTPQLDECFQLLCLKNQDLYVTDAVQKLLNESLTPSQIQSIYHNDKSKTPMVIHQNYIAAISAQKTNVNRKLEAAINTIDSLVVSDVIEKIIYGNQTWGLQPVQSVACAQIPAYYINRHPKVNHVDAKWTSILSVNSQALNLRKNLYHELHQMSTDKTYNITEIQHLIEVIFHNMLYNHHEQATELLLKNGLCSKEIEEAKKRFRSKDKKKKPPKALTIIDKVAKYIKLSPYYDLWAKYLNANKNNNEMDQRLHNLLGTTNLKEQLAASESVQEEFKKILENARREKITNRPKITVKGKKPIKSKVTVKVSPVNKTGIQNNADDDKTDGPVKISITPKSKTEQKALVKKRVVKIKSVNKK